MTGLDHYRDLFDDAETVGGQVLARAIYAARHGDGDDASANDLTRIFREDIPAEWGETIDADDAILLAGLEADPLPPWVVDRIARLFAGPGHDKGYRALARRIGAHRNTVEKWVHGESPCEGPSRYAVRTAGLEKLRVLWRRI